MCWHGHINRVAHCKLQNGKRRLTQPLDQRLQSSFLYHMHVQLPILLPRNVAYIIALVSFRTQFLFPVMPHLYTHPCPQKRVGESSNRAQATHYGTFWYNFIEAAWQSVQAKLNQQIFSRFAREHIPLSALSLLLLKQQQNFVVMHCIFLTQTL